MNNKINELFVQLQQNATKKSQDPSTKVGAYLIDENYYILAEGYNNFPNHQHNYSWQTKDLYENTKYPYVVHAETNMIIDFIYTQRLQFHNFNQLIILVTLLPCNECAKFIISLPIKTVYYLEDREEWNMSVKQLFKNQQIALIKFNLKYSK